MYQYLHRPIRHLALLTVLIGVVAIPAGADAQPATSYSVRIYAQGGAAPISTYDIPAAQVTCGLAKLVVGTATANPTRISWDDPADATKDCRWTDAGTGPLFALPFSSTLIYEMTLRAVNSVGPTPESGRSNPFSRPGAVPPTPGHLRVP